MSEMLSKPPRRGRRTVVFSSLAAVAAMLLASVGAAPAQADGVGTASVRGTDPDASASILGVGTIPVAAQYSAITNCDETANNRPFIITVSPSNYGGFTRASTATSTCKSSGATSINDGTGAGFGFGALTGMLTVHWHFADNPDNVTIDLSGINGDLHISGAPAPLNGTPGGVWVFGTLPWPAGT